MGSARFGKVLTAMVTPFGDDGELDIAGAAELARWLVDQGNDGLVLAGTTGEAPTLSDDEKVELWRAVRQAVDVPIVAGTGSNDTRHSVHLTKRAADCGVDGILAVTPYYNRPSQAGIDAHFRAIAAASTLPVLIYDIPVRTGRKVATDVLVRLANEVPTVAGIKDAAGNPGETARVIAGAPDDFDVYSGDDSQTLPLLAVGAVGVIGVATHWLAATMADALAAFDKGDLARARELNARMLRSFAFETGDACPNPGPTKALLGALGLPAGECRLPMGPIPDAVRAEARDIIAELGLPT
ncbi:MAG TPA: 4-hydroxy-tetrahydrodipicolinate synthase [Acidimicrobiales bacterium]|jgi:4-hydroxy-tetrahydrodipicolinate synthase